MNRIYKYLLLICIGSSCYSYGQENNAWSLKRCIDYALDNNIDIKKVELIKELADVSLNESQWAFSPSFGISSSLSFATGRVLDQTTYEFVKNNVVGNSSASIYASMSLFSGFKRVLALRKAKLERELGDVAVDVYKRMLKEEITAHYLTVYCCQNNLESAKQQKVLIESELERIQLMSEVGRITESDYLQARAQLFSAENDITIAESELKKAILSLCTLLGLANWESFSIDVRDLIIATQLYPLSSKSLVESHPEYKSAALDIAIAKKELIIAKLSYLPTLSLSVGYGSSASNVRLRSIQNADGTLSYESYPISLQYFDNANAYVSMGISIPLFNAMNTRNNVKRKSITVRDAEYAFQKKEKELIREYNELIIDASTAYQQYLLTKEQLNYSEEAERTIRERYNHGVDSYVTWNAAVTELARVRYALSNAECTFLFQHILLGFYELQ